MKNLIKHTILLGLFFVFANFISGKREANIRYDVAPHVVSFNILKNNNARFATGFHLEYKGEVFIMTNKHVCDLHKVVYSHEYIQFEDYVGEIIAIDEEHDLCLVTSNRQHGLKLAENPVNVMDEVVLVGHPRGKAKTIRKGHVTEYDDGVFSWVKKSKINAYEISTTTYGGNSGSPVVNLYGEVVGVLFAGPMFHVTEGIVVPLFYVQDFLERTLGE